MWLVGPTQGRVDCAEADAARTGEIERYDVLSSPAGRELQALVELAAQIFDVPTAAINLITGSQQRQVATAGIEPSDCARSDSMCATVLSEEGAVVVSDTHLDPRFQDNPFVTGVIGAVRFYASAPLLSSNGVPIGRLCVFDEEPRAITSRQEQGLGILAHRVMDVLELRFKTHQLEQAFGELTRAQSELRRSNEALMHFAGQVSHDLRNPLQAIRSNAELLASEPAVEDDPDLAFVVTQITECCVEMGGLIREVLAHARSGSLPRRRPTDLRTVVDRALRDLGHQVEESAATITVGELHEVYADPDLIYAVVVNLLSNAVKFRRPDVPPTVQIQAERHADRDRVIVSDDGRGIPPGTEEAVFLPYVRADDDATGEGPAGHGIGLATVHRIVQAHGGDVALMAREGGGTQVWFELPISPTNTANSP